MAQLLLLLSVQWVAKGAQKASEMVAARRKLKQRMFAVRDVWDEKINIGKNSTVFQWLVRIMTRWMFHHCHQYQLLWDSIIPHMPCSRDPDFRMCGSGTKLLYQGVKFGLGISTYKTSGCYRARICSPMQVISGWEHCMGSRELLNSPTGQLPTGEGRAAFV